jgi:hypothetical protein
MDTLSLNMSRQYKLVRFECPLTGLNLDEGVFTRSIATAGATGVRVIYAIYKDEPWPVA